MYSAKSSFFSLWTLSEELLSEFSVILDPCMCVCVCVCVYEHISLAFFRDCAYLFRAYKTNICEITAICRILYTLYEKKTVLADHWTKDIIHSFYGHFH